VELARAEHHLGTVAPTRLVMNATAVHCLWPKCSADKPLSPAHFRRRACLHSEGGGHYSRASAARSVTIEMI